MSEAALVDSITLELDMAHAAGVQHLLVTPGNYGEDYARDHLGWRWRAASPGSNYRRRHRHSRGGAGLFQLPAGGASGQAGEGGRRCHEHHSRTADGRRETMAAHAALCGAPRGLVGTVFEAATTDAALELLGGGGAAGGCDGLFDQGAL